MLDFPRWKITSILVLLAALMALAIPSFFSEDQTKAWGWIPHPRINLGLDLAGGSYLLLEADTNDLINQRVEQKRDEVAAALRRATPKIDIGEIAEMTSQVAITGAIRVSDGVGDDMFEYLVGIAILIYEMFPNGG